MSDLLNSERAELERLRARNSALEEELGRFRMQSDAWQTKGLEYGSRLGAAIDHLENLIAHLDTPIGRRKLGIDPNTVWLNEAREFCDSYGRNHEIGDLQMDAQRARQIRELAGAIREQVHQGNQRTTSVEDLRIAQRHIVEKVDLIDAIARMQPEDAGKPGVTICEVDNPTRYRAKRISLIVDKMRAYLDLPVVDSQLIADRLSELQDVLNTKSELPEADENGGRPIVVGLSESDIFELNEGYRHDASDRMRNNARHCLDEILLRGLDHQDLHGADHPAPGPG